MKDLELGDGPMRRRREVPFICQQKIPVHTTETPGNSSQNTNPDLMKTVNTTETPGISPQNIISDLIDAVNLITDLLAKLVGALSDSHFIKSQ